MGAWGPGPFDNDAAADFLDEAGASPARLIVKTLRSIAGAPAARDIEVDEGGAGWAACELVAIAFGHGDTDGLADAVLEVAARLKPMEAHRLLAIEALPRIADPVTSEVAGLWHEGNDGAAFDASIAALKVRLTAAAAGPRELPRARKGDVIGMPTAPGAADLFVVQVVGPREVAVFDGVWPDDAAALAATDRAPARRVPTGLGKLLRRGRLLANRPIRKDLGGKKLYAAEGGGFDDYWISTATGTGGLRIASYEEARAHDLHWYHSEKALLAVARGRQPIAHVHSVEEREAELAARHKKEWAARRRSTTPGPFGDVASLAKRLQWSESYGVKNWIAVSHDIATEMQGYGRPAEDDERSDYAFAALVAIWRGTLPRKLWPVELKARLPPRPDKTLMAKALRAARVLAAKVITRDAELRLIWDRGPDKGAELRRWVARLQRALA